MAETWVQLASNDRYVWEGRLRGNGVAMAVRKLTKSNRRQVGTTYVAQSEGVARRIATTSAGRD